MIVIGARLVLAPAGIHSALDNVSFLGGVIHGAMENLLRERAPEIAAALGMGSSNRIKPYAILPPPFGWEPQNSSGNRELPFGIVLHGDAAAHAEDVAVAINAWPEVRLAGRVDQVRSVEISVGTPGGSPVHWSPGQAFPSGSGAPTLVGRPARATVTLRFLTPLLLTSSDNNTAAERERPPGLLRIVRALRRRIESADPSLFAQLAGNDWVASEEAIRPLEAQARQWREVTWRYGSRTKPSPVNFRGYLGSLHFRAPASTPIPGPIWALLQWGTWFGLGQRTALGQGMYILQEDTP